MNKVTRTGWGPDGDQIHQVKVRPRWCPETLDLGKVQERNRFTRSKRPPWGPLSLGMVEAKVAPHSPSPGKANLQATVTRSR